jgi:hypothetical protein
MPSQDRTRRLTAADEAAMRRRDDDELRRRDAQTEEIIAMLQQRQGASPAPSLRDMLFPRASEVPAPTDAQRAAHEARVRDAQAEWGPVRRRLTQAMGFAGKHGPDFLGGALWGDPTAPGASRANLLGQMLTAGLPLASGIKGGIRTGRGLFSRLDAAIDLIPVKGAHPNKVASLLSRASKEELEHRGVPAFLAAQGNTPVTREALRAHLQAHPAPFPKVSEGTYNWETAPHSELQVPGGTNYRETVLTLPNERLERAGQALEEFEQRLLADVPITTRWSLIREDGSAAPSYHTRQAAEDARWNPAQRIEETPTRVSPQLPAEGTPLRDEYERLRDAVAVAKRGDQYQYQSTHFDEPNVLVHTRSNERTLPTGERGRFLEEVQSDWHQAGKQRGYADPDTARGISAKADAILDQMKAKHGTEDSLVWGPKEPLAFAEYQQTLSELGSVGGGVPDAPFKDSWPDLGFKQQLLEVADDPTLDWIGWTSGKTQAARYDLSEKIGQVTARPTLDGLVHLGALTPDMGTVVMNKWVSPDELDGIIGKEISEKIRAGIRFPTSPGDRGVSVELTGLDLQVGGEGMVEFYDRLLPKRVAKIVKPFGGTVERVEVPTVSNIPVLDQHGALAPEPAWVVRLTPEMKAKIKQGLPLLALPAGVQVSASRPEED